MEIPEFSVAQVCDIIKTVLEDTFGTIKITGELKDCKINSSSGHAYFTVTDGSANLKCVSWAGINQSFAHFLVDGKMLTLTGKITSYAKSSTYQMAVHKAENAGAGALALLLEILKKKLTAEGLFDQSRKKPLPVYPQIIGIISSRTGSVLHDIIHVLTRRYSCRVLLYHASMQGDSAAKDCISGLKYFNNCKSVDVIILARGGGSSEDLMPFNNEALVRTIAASHIPVISAVGHETDFSLCDFAADVRAPTPSAAAEIVIPDKKEIIAYLTSTQNIMQKNVISIISMYLTNLKTMEQAMMDRVRNAVYSANIQLLSSKQKMISLVKIFIANKTNSLDSQAIGMQNYKHIITKHNHNLNIWQKIFELSNPDHILKKGYAIVKNSDGNTIAGISDANTKMIIKMHDGEISVVKEFLI